MLYGSHTCLLSLVMYYLCEVLYCLQSTFTCIFKVNKMLKMSFSKNVFVYILHIEWWHTEPSVCGLQQPGTDPAACGLEEKDRLLIWCDACPLAAAEAGGWESSVLPKLQVMKSGCLRNKGPRASLVAQWLRVCLPMQETWVRALVHEDPTCHGATRPMRHNY